ncbi:hypothetical protein [Actinomadura rudentiformis]|uniref:Uncharacterized protein n=1 Tax=Actinomadura rudentiformis TaxID=359158 RepID=A0A6H9YXT1_9ACTN|nr:hypothetical protein [Actinomadura rudentiformis]KAB2346572.1 hypothetical protein F8566_24320 [Actinomadura rudentiformis]
MFIVIAVAALVGLLVPLILVAAFSRSSRRDALYAPATGQTRWARRVAGMYIRDDYTARRDEYTGYHTRMIEHGDRTGEDELVGR